ncbi:peptidylprolyl isomerase [Candidatus Thermokryptus mobilis]|uniref:peptidylprolyl isomerase n=1 Tax=Candidatus Thermokryptus mobilis TaxID=1643428 RepID=UPI0015E39763|nr:peptidylprolyl isomerase [Candidatus Thermokryptus mobilis]
MKRLLIVSLLAMVFGCSKKTGNEDYIARVDGEYLLRRDVAGLDSSFVRNYIDKWIINNLIYKEALERGYDKKDEKIERMVNEFRKSLIINKFVQDEIVRKASSLSDDEVREFYQKHKDEFILDRPFVKIGYVKLKSRTDASILRGRITRTRNFKEAISGLISESSVLEIVESRYFDQLSISSSDLWKVAWNLSPGEVSFPVRSGDSYFLIYLYDKIEPGESADFELVADDVKQRAIVEKQNRLLDSLVSNLRKKYNYEVRW